MPRVGEMACTNPKCSCQDVAVNETASGNWSATCHKCGMPTFGKKGTRWRRDMESLTRLDASDAPAPSPAPAAGPAPAPAAPAPAPKPSGYYLS